MPPQLTPPWLPGNCTRSRLKAGGRYGPPSCTPSSSLRQPASISGVTVATSPAAMLMRDSGGVTSGNGCVFAARSSGTSLAGTGRSSTASMGLPVVRSRRNSSPCLLATATAGIVLPARVTSRSTGAAARSASQMS